MIANETQPEPEPSDCKEQERKPPKSSLTSLSSTSLTEEKLNEIIHKDAQDVLETELRCAICQDIYINPMILNCSHSFCRFCVRRWLSRKTVCPECRVSVSFQAENLALRNIVNKMVQKSSPQFQSSRTTSVNQRLKDEEAQKKETSFELRLKRGPENNTGDTRRSSGRYRDLQVAHLFRLATQRLDETVGRQAGTDNNSSGTETGSESDYWNLGDVADVWSPTDSTAHHFGFLFRHSDDPTSGFLRDDESESGESGSDSSSDDNDSDATDIDLGEVEPENQDNYDHEDSEDDSDETFEDVDVSDEHDHSVEEIPGYNWDRVIDGRDMFDLEDSDHETDDNESESDSSDSSATENGTGEHMELDNYVVDFMMGSDSDDSDDDSTEVYDWRDRCRYSDESTVLYSTDDDSS